MLWHTDNLFINNDIFKEHPMEGTDRKHKFQPKTMSQKGFQLGRTKSEHVAFA